MTTTLHIIPTVATDATVAETLDLASIVRVSASDERAVAVAEMFRRDAAAWAARDLEGAGVADEAAGDVRFELRGEGGSGPLSPSSREALGEHEIAITPSGIRVSSDHEEGLSRGAASVVQLLAGSETAIGARVIRDGAAWGWRALSLDVVRFFSPVERVLQVIDLLALYKFSVLHLHLSDNEGWRLEIPGWPRLTPATAGTREYFTIEEYRRIVEYAARRFITVVPEIDLPGHAAAALRAYPELNPADAANLGGPFPIANLSPDSEAAWRLVDDVVRTLVENTPGPFVHIGGDEAFGMDAAAHESFVEHAIAAVAAHSKSTVGWQETSRAAVGPDHTAQYWVDFDIDAPRDESAAGSKSGSDIPEDSMAAMVAHFAEAMGDRSRILEKGTHVVVSPISHAYLDRPHAEASTDPAQEEQRSRVGLQYYPGTPVRDYLEWDPTTVLAGVDPSRIRGVEAAIWCESVTAASDIDALLLPRLPAVAEVAWAGSRRSDWEGFRSRIAHHALLWDASGWEWFEVDSVDWRRSWVRG
ncbi:family 20 glycosylhydrolase [Microbacterium sp. NPDC089320]|uniref:family 20 glycosylhydrolase n=1 Tax=Microbacterium sp. NPDC089320 TaxID=3155182 RepID=UPI00341E3633